MMQRGHIALLQRFAADAVAREAEQIVREQLERLAAFYDEPTIEASEV